MKRLLPVLITIALFCPLLANADYIPVTGSDLISSRSINTGGLVALDKWLEDFTISWNISFNPDTGLWGYSYNLASTTKEPSHFIIEVSASFTRANYWGPAVSVGTWAANPCAATVAGGQDKQNNAGGNPCLPEDLYGLKPGDANAAQITFYSDRIPVWGDFYGKSGAGSVVWNAGIGTDPTAADAPFRNWIPTPDTFSQVPEPGSILLLGTVLAGIGIVRLRR